MKYAISIEKGKHYTLNIWKPACATCISELNESRKAALLLSNSV